jgi:hypothetical protein
MNRVEPAPLKTENPYVGPRPFEERTEPFFGRDWEADELGPW